MVFISSKNAKGCRMNLFTSYTPEETKFLLSLTDKKFTRNVHPILLGVNTHKLSHFYNKTLPKKEIIKEFEFIIVNKGKVGVIKNGKIIKTLKENDIFGILKNFLNEEYILLTLENCNITFFGIGECEEIKNNLLTYLSKQIKNKIII
jgi:hypothetical protein